jgi:peptidyl-prolyl cis-trans isomerase B (cyclophilin B)
VSPGSADNSLKFSMRPHRQMCPTTIAENTSTVTINRFWFFIIVVTNVFLYRIFCVFILISVCIMEFLTFLMIGVGMLALLKFLTDDCGYSISSIFTKADDQNIKEIVSVITPPPHAKPEEPRTPDNVDTPYVFLNMYEGEKEIGDIVIYLYESDVPITTKNFKTLCETRYKNSTFHRIIKDFMLQGGDYTNHNGTGGASIYNGKFNDENFKYKNKKGTISMANAGKNTNGSQFFINTSDNHGLDGKHVVFGEVVEGMDVVEYLNNVSTGVKDVPNTSVRIRNCGRIWLEEKTKTDEDEIDASDRKKYSEFLESQ